ncbi:MAG: hypothetical protein ACRCU3_10530 [Eubacteriaceae bacterium]
MKKKLITAIAAAALCVSMTMPALAASNTDVYAGVAVDALDADPQLRVTVPTLFAFVVNGSNDLGGVGLDPANTALLMPNATVVADASPAGYTISYTGSSTLDFSNASTINAPTASGRTGIPVEISGVLTNQAGSAWTNVAATPTIKEYTLAIGGEAFDTPQGTGLGMAAPLTLAAPNASAAGSVDAGNLANTPAQESKAFALNVGGTRGDYTTIEDSAKVGAIEWTVGYTPAP